MHIHEAYVTSYTYAHTTCDTQGTLLLIYKFMHEQPYDASLSIVL
jgi:hypothetical protein